MVKNPPAISGDIRDTGLIAGSGIQAVLTKYASDVKLNYSNTRGFSGWLSGKESTCNAGDTRDMGSIPGSGRCPGGGNGNPLQYSCLANSMERRTWQAIVHGVVKSRTLLSMHKLSYSIV